MSHLTKIKTSIRDENILQKTLSDCDLKWEKLYLQSHNSKPNYCVKQSNKIDLQFNWNGEDYEMITDIQFWQQSLPLELFLNKLNQRYAYNSIIEKGKNAGFETIKEVKNVQGTITLTLRRWT
uniref:Uncharacterized protein ycf35 n=1 Tax=Flintiella sanguinaria TaxID=101926 RepID=A0A1X9PU71_9RHOD|nr:conserved hypothetical plastid protein [Flintiella sanguinaria]